MSKKLFPNTNTESSYRRVVYKLNGETYVVAIKAATLMASRWGNRVGPGYWVYSGRKIPMHERRRRCVYARNVKHTRNFWFDFDFAYKKRHAAVRKFKALVRQALASSQVSDVVMTTYHQGKSAKVEGRETVLARCRPGNETTKSVAYS